jgi:hypothetical protein
MTPLGCEFVVHGGAFSPGRYSTGCWPAKRLDANIMRSNSRNEKYMAGYGHGPNSVGEPPPWPKRLAHILKIR